MVDENPFRILRRKSTTRDELEEVVSLRIRFVRALGIKMKKRKALGGRLEVERGGGRVSNSSTWNEKGSEKLVLFFFIEGEDTQKGNLHERWLSMVLDRRRRRGDGGRGEGEGWRRRSEERSAQISKVFWKEDKHGER